MCFLKLLILGDSPISMWPFGNRPLTPSTQKIRDPLNSNIEQVEQQFNPESDEENRLSTSNPSESTITQSTDFELEQLRELAARWAHIILTAKHLS